MIRSETQTVYIFLSFFILKDLNCSQQYKGGTHEVESQLVAFVSFHTDVMKGAFRSEISKQRKLAVHFYFYQVRQTEHNNIQKLWCSREIESDKIPL